MPVGNDSRPLIKDVEWSELIDRYLNQEQGQDCYASGYQDGQRDALQEVIKIISGASEVVVDDETHHIITNLASIMSLMVTNITNVHLPAGSR